MSPAALAQTVYGLVDVGYQHAKYADGFVNKHFIQSGQQFGSRLGVRGNEDLAAGTYATYLIEFSIMADTGGAGATDTARQTFVGLGSKAWGELTLGRQYTHTYHAFGVGSASGYGTFSSFLISDGPAITQRVSNSVKYLSPVMAGVSVGALWSPGESTTPGEMDNGDYADLGVRWTLGPITLAASHARAETRRAAAAAVAPSPGNIGTAAVTAAVATLTQNQITGNWDNRAFGTYAGYITRRDEGQTTDSRAYWFNPVARFGGRHEVYGLWGRVRNKAAAAADADVMAVTYQHVLSKRTRVYTSLGRVDNDPGSAVELNAFAASVAPGYDPRGFQLGVLHAF